MLGAQAAHADKIDDAAKKLSEASYPFLKEIDWTSDVYAKLPTQNPLAVMKAIDRPPSDPLTYLRALHASKREEPPASPDGVEATPVGVDAYLLALRFYTTTGQ